MKGNLKKGIIFKVFEAVVVPGFYLTSKIPNVLLVFYKGRSP